MINLPFHRNRNKLREADEQLEQARLDLRHTKAETARFTALGRRMQEIQEENGLSELLTQAFRGQR